MCYGTRTDAQKVERRGVFWLGRIHNCETKSSNILFLVLIKWKQNYPKDRIDRMSREPHYTPEELFVKFTEAGRVGQRQRPIDKKRLQEFLFLMSFLYYLATIGTVAGDSDNLSRTIASDCLTCLDLVWLVWRAHASLKFRFLATLFGFAESLGTPLGLGRRLSTNLFRAPSPCCLTLIYRCFSWAWFLYFCKCLPSFCSMAAQCLW